MICFIKILICSSTVHRHKHATLFQVIRLSFKLFRKFQIEMQSQNLHDTSARWKKIVPFSTISSTYDAKFFVKLCNNLYWYFVIWTIPCEYVFIFLDFIIFLVPLYFTFILIALHFLISAAGCGNGVSIVMSFVFFCIFGCHCFLWCIAFFWFYFFLKFHNHLCHNPPHQKHPSSCMHTNLEIKWQVLYMQKRNKKTNS